MFWPTGKRALSTEFSDSVAIDLRRDEWLRYLGYAREASPRRPIAPELEQLLESGQRLLHPRAAFAVHAVEANSGHQLEFGGKRVHGQVASYLGKAEQVVVFVVSVGNEISEASAAASSKGDVVRAWGLDALGSCAAEATAEALSAQVRERVPPDQSLSPRYSPGYCGMQLDQQEVIFDLIDAGSIGVTLDSSMTMQPAKSISGLLGIGPLDAFPGSETPCDRCTAVNCHMRR